MRLRVLLGPGALLAVILVVYGAFLLSCFAPAISDPDANGYWAQGSLLFTTGHTWFKPEAHSQYIGMHWLITPEGRYFSRYAPGLPVLVGLVYETLGYKASVLVNPVLAWLSLVGLFLLMRRLLTAGWAVVGVLVLALNPTFNHHALACDAHMAVTFCLTWGMYLLVRWSENGRLWEAFAAGLVLGAIPTIRYPEALFGLAVAVFLIWNYRSHPRIWMHYLAAALGASIVLVPMLVRNQLAFGAFWRTAYELTNEQTGFAWQYFKEHFLNYLREVHGDGMGLFFALGAMGMTMMCGLRRWRPIGVLLVLVTIPTTVLYMFYYWGPQMRAGATMRFLLPTFVCYIVAGLWFLSQTMAQTPVALRGAVVGVVLALQGIWGGFTSFSDARLLHYQKAVLARVADALDHNIQRDDVVMANQQILQNLDFVRYWRLADAPTAAARPGFGGRFFGRDRDPDAPSPMQEEKRKIQEEKYKGLTPGERERKIAQDLHKWAGQHKVYYVGLEKDIEGMEGVCFNPKSFKVVARVTLPEAPPPPQAEGMMGGGFRGRRGGDRSPLPGPAGGGPDMRPPGGEGGPPPGPPGAGPDFRPPGGPPMGFGFGGGQRFRRGGGGGGGMFGLGFLQGEKELVIAEWTFKRL